MRPRPYYFALLLLAIATVLLGPGAALAQLDPEVERASQEALGGEFEAASTHLEAALARNDLSREDLIAIYEARVFISYAGGDSRALGEDLERIAALDPTHSFDRNYYATEVTDAFRETVERRAGRLALETEALLLATGELEVRGEIHNDPGDLARSIQVYGREAGGTWQQAEASLRADIAAGGSSEYYAEAIGPGGAVVANDGTESAPLVFEGEAGVDGGGVPLWVWIGGAAVIVAAVIIIAAVAASGGVSDDTQPSPPMVRFTM